MKKIVALFSFFMLSIAGICQAEPLPRHSVTIGPEVYYYVYQEKTNGVDIDGVFLGLTGTANANFDNHLMLQGELRAAFAEADVETGSAEIDSDEDVWEARFLAGYNFIDTEEMLYSVYSGFGYRRLNDEFAGTSVAPKLDRTATYYYLPLGLQGAKDYGNGWRAQTQIEVDYVFDGEQELEQGALNISGDLEDGLGFRLGVRIQKLGQRFNFFVEPFFRYWKLDGSNSTGSASIVTKNTTTELGVNCQLVF